MELTSRAFADGEAIPVRHTCDGDDASPTLAWSDLPDGTRSLALLVEDPDASFRPFVHWLAWGIDIGRSELREGEPGPVEGRNDFGAHGYRGPCPPPGHEPHRYVFRLYALTREIAVSPGAGRRDLERALEGAVLEVAELRGFYGR